MKTQSLLEIVNVEFIKQNTGYFKKMKFKDILLFGFLNFHILDLEWINKGNFKVH